MLTLVHSSVGCSAFHNYEIRVGNVNFFLDYSETQDGLQIGNTVFFFFPDESVTNSFQRAGKPGPEIHLRALNQSALGSLRLARLHYNTTE